MAVLRYAGIGARVTPAAVLADMTVMAGWLVRTGWHLASGGADGADSAFAAGAPAEQRTVWLPWRGYRGHGGPGCRVLSVAGLSACMEIAAPLHPAWERCSPAVRKLHARNVAILLGEGGTGPSMQSCAGRPGDGQRAAREWPPGSHSPAAFRCSTWVRWRRGRSVSGCGISAGPRPRRRAGGEHVSGGGRGLGGRGAPTPVLSPTIRHFNLRSEESPPCIRLRTPPTAPSPLSSRRGSAPFSR